MPDAARPSDLSTFRLRRRTPGSFVLVPCPRLGRAIRCQGQLEAAAAVVLAACPLVTAVQEQPLSVWYAWREADGGVQIRLLSGKPPRGSRSRADCRLSHIVPDFLVEMQGGERRLVEVKPSRKLASPSVRRKLAVARQFAARSGWAFHAVTERELFRGPLLPNLRLLARYRRLNVPPGLLTGLEQAASRGPVSIAALLRQAGAQEQQSSLRAAVFHLLAAGRLAFDPRAAPLNDDTLLLPGGAIPWDPFDSAWAPSGCSTNGPTASSASPPPTASSPAT